MNNWYIWLVI